MIQMGNYLVGCFVMLLGSSNVSVEVHIRVVWRLDMKTFFMSTDQDRMISAVLFVPHEAKQSFKLLHQIVDVDAVVAVSVVIQIKKGMHEDIAVDAGLFKEGKEFIVA